MAISIDPETGLKRFNTRASKATEKISGKGYSLVDEDLLKTLPAEEVISGLGEIIKYGAILDSQFFNKISNWVQDLPNFPFAEAIEKCCKLKADIVSKDELDNNLRAILNFGHTIGHALELKFGFNKLKPVSYTHLTLPTNREV